MAPYIFTSLYYLRQPIMFYFVCLQNVNLHASMKFQLKISGKLQVNYPEGIM